MEATAANIYWKAFFENSTFKNLKENVSGDYPNNF